MSKKVLFTSNVGIRPLGSGVGGGSGDGFSILELELAGAKMGGGGGRPLVIHFIFFKNKLSYLTYTQPLSLNNLCKNH